MRDPYIVIQQPLLTEKNVDHADYGKYVFRVATDANKVEIRHAIEAIYKVPVKAVNTMNVRGEMRRVGRGRPGRQPSWKKAIVTLEPGHALELFEGV